MIDFEKYKKETLCNIEKQRNFFAEGKSRNVDYRINQLNKLKIAITRYEKEIAEALKNDLGKSYEESYLTEIGIVINELKLHIKKIRKWAKPNRVSTPLFLFPSQSFTQYEPLGVTLIISPWNYPFQLLFNPLIASVSAGNCTVVKPSPNTPKSNKIMTKIIKETFDPGHVCLIEGDNRQTQFILEQSFDFIFYTGSSSFGKNVMKAAADHLTPVVLELGGKSPCIVDKESNVELAAKRITWGKLLNAGQTCVAPDYIWVHKSLEKQLVEQLIKQIKAFYGEEPLSSPFYPKIIHKEAFNRLKTYLSQGSVVFGGQYDEEQHKISPTIISDINLESDIMKDEIFGPILPIITFDRIEHVVDEINKQDKPLALYYFGKEKKAKKIINRTSSGGVCINDVVVHLSNHNLPFGGVGASGMGEYHGKHSFKAFSNERSLFFSSTKIDIPFKYVPFKLFAFVKKLL